MIAVYSTILALFVSLALVPLLARWAEALGLLDKPGPRKIHEHPIPRVGGIAIAAGALVSMLTWVSLQRPEMLGYLVGGSLIVTFGVVDDRVDLHYRIKFAAQVTGALLFILIGDIWLTRAPFINDLTMPAWVGIPLTTLVLVAVTNAVNLSDGMDGLAGSISLINTGFFGFLAYQADDSTVALVALCLIGAIFGFLRYNSFPARVFMGDAGSQFLGFSVAILGVMLIERSDAGLSPMVPLAALGLPILDTLHVSWRRVGAGRSPFAPDREHLHHRLLDGGLSQYEALLVVYGLQGGLLAIAWSFRHAHDLVLLAAFGAFSAGLLFAMSWWERHPTHGRAVFRRLDVVDPLVEYLKAGDIVKRVGHHGVVYGASLLFLTASVWVDHVPADIGWLAVLLLLTLLFAWLPFLGLANGILYRLAAFATGALVVYLIEKVGLRGYGDPTWLRAYLVIIAFCLALWLRMGGTGDFRLNTLDVLVLLIVAIVPNMPLVKELGIGVIVIEALLLFYSAELILSERPAKWRFFKFAMLASLAIFAVRGMAL